MTSREESTISGLTRDRGIRLWAIRFDREFGKWLGVEDESVGKRTECPECRIVQPKTWRSALRRMTLNLSATFKYETSL